MGRESERERDREDVSYVLGNVQYIPYNTHYVE